MKRILIAASPIALPFVALAAQIRNINDLISSLGNILNSVAPLVIGLAFLWFIWGVVKYITAGSEEEDRNKGRDMMIWGIIALFVMTSVWGLVGILSGTFELSNTQPTAPTIYNPRP
ncbi:MAG: pilin [Candidatus Paceibacterota bacterium]|jgi:hypothetical protein